MHSKTSKQRMSMLKCLALLSLAFDVACTTATRQIPPPPATEAKPVTETLHGVAITDPYRWLEDQQSPETRSWIERENAYTDKVLGDLADKAKFAKRIEELQKTDSISLPVVRAGRYFFTKRAA